MPWDALTRILEASNKFLFAGAIVFFLVWLLGPGDPAGQWDRYTVFGFLSLFCSLALLYEAAVNAAKFASPVIERYRQRKIKEAEEKEQTRLAYENRGRVLEQFEYLDQREKVILGLLYLKNRRLFHAPLSNPWLSTLRNRGFIIYAKGKYDTHDRLHEIPDYVWEYLGQHIDHLRKMKVPDGIDPIEPWRGRT
jgi:hypothetical protein